MIDQAENLRQRVREGEDLISKKLSPPVYAIASGKGGVGKSNIAVNLAWALSQRGSKTLLFDADFGLGNTDILLGISPQATLADVLSQKKTLSDVAVSLNKDLTLLPSGSGDFNFANANAFALEGMCLEIEKFARGYENVVVDTGAGIGERVLSALLVSDEIFIVTTPDPTSLTDSYATIKMVAQQDRTKNFRVIVNMADTEAEAQTTFEQLAFVTRKYLKIELKSWSWIPKDRRVPMAIRKQEPIAKLDPEAPSSQAFRRLASGILRKPEPRNGFKLKEWINAFVKGQTLRPKAEQALG